MGSPKLPTQNRIIQLVLILGLAAFIIYLVFFVDLAQVTKTLSATNLTVYAGAFIAYLLYTFFSSLVWHGLLSNLAVKISRSKAFLFTWVGLFFDATIPQLGWSAEVSKTYLLAKDSNIEAGKIGASVVGQKLFTMTMTIAALSAGLVLVLFRFSLDFLVAALLGLVLVLSILALSIVYYVAIKPSATNTLLNLAIKIMLVFRKNWDPQNFKVKADQMLSEFHISMEQLKAKPKGLIQPIVFSVASFACEVSVVFLSFTALGQPLPVDVVLVVFTLTGTLQTVGIAFVGFPEIVMSLTFQGLGIQASIAVSIALLTRAVNLWFRLVLSYAALQWAGLKIIRQNKNV